MKEIKYIFNVSAIIAIIASLISFILTLATHQERNDSTHQEKNKTWSSRKKQDPTVKS